MAKETINRAAVMKMNIFTNLCCKLVSKPAEYTQAAGQHNIKHQTLYYIRMVSQTLSQKKFLLGLHSRY
jgi:beta-galactosidase beta subunit